MWTTGKYANGDVGGVHDEHSSAVEQGKVLVKSIAQLFDARTNGIALAGPEPFFQPYGGPRSFEPPAVRDRFDDEDFYETMAQNASPQFLEFETWWRSGGREESLRASVDDDEMRGGTGEA